MMETDEGKDKVLLHVCCACCCTECIERLKDEYEVILFFSNSNIFPKEEYEKRLENARKIASVYGIKLIEDNYEHNKWREFVRGLEDEPEGGKRCSKCFEFNLKRTKEKVDELGINQFTTTLTISPHKCSKVIFEFGKKIDGEKFLPIDFKKRDGFGHSIELSKKHNLYRQNYCGGELNNNIASPKE